MADFAIHPKTGEKKEIHSHYPQIRQDNQVPDCLFCVNAGTCEKHKGMFFVDETRKPCEKYRCRREVEIDEPNRKRAEEKERQAAIKAIKTPVPRPDGESKDCLYCKTLKEESCYNGGFGPWQGQGRVCERYNEVNIRPEGKEKHCIYCLKNYLCNQWRIKNRPPCEKYVEYVPGNAEAASA